MADKEIPTLVEKRLISGRGIIKIPPSPKYRFLYLYVNVVRLPIVNFGSSKSNPDKSEYCRLTWNRNGYVQKEDILNFENQLFTWQDDPVGYVATALTCLVENIYTYFDYLATLSQGVPLPRAGKIYIEALKNTPEEIKIVCRLNTAVEVQLWRYYYDVACEQGDPNPPPPPDPPPPPKTPSDIPLGEISPPYEQPSDGGDTIPYPGDDSPSPYPPTEGDECVSYTVTFTADYYSSSTEYQTITQTLHCFAPLGRPYIVPSPPGLNPVQQVAIYSSGIAELSEPCGSLHENVVTNFNTPGGVKNLVVDVFEPSS